MEHLYKITLKYENDIQILITLKWDFFLIFKSKNFFLPSCIFVELNSKQQPYRGEKIRSL